MNLNHKLSVSFNGLQENRLVFQTKGPKPNPEVMVMPEETIYAKSPKGMKKHPKTEAEQKRAEAEKIVKQMTDAFDAIREKQDKNPVKKAEAKADKRAPKKGGRS